MVVERATLLKYLPLAVEGLRRCRVSSSEVRFSRSLSAPNESLPIGACTMPVFSVRNSIRPALISRMARATSMVTVPTFGLGIRLRGPRMRPRRPTRPIMSGVAMALSKSSQFSLRTRSTRSSAPTKSAPASRASAARSPLAKTTTRRVLPVPLGSAQLERIIWSACFGLTPRRAATSTVSSNLVYLRVGSSSQASTTV